MKTVPELTGKTRQAYSLICHGGYERKCLIIGPTIGTGLLLLAWIIPTEGHQPGQ